MVFKLCKCTSITYISFENDVKMYGIQTVNIPMSELKPFENDVKMYGIQTVL